MNYLKKQSIVICCLFSALWSGAQGMEGVWHNQPNRDPHRYTYAFESKLSANINNLACERVNKGGGIKEFTPSHRVVTGYSEGPNGRTTHYKDVSATYITAMDSFSCKYCDYPYYLQIPSYHAPKIEFRREGNTRVLMIDESVNKLLMCRKPRLQGDLLEIWNVHKHYTWSWKEGLEKMWESARWLDAHPKVQGATTDVCSFEELPKNDIVYEVRTSSCCIQ